MEGEVQGWGGGSELVKFGDKLEGPEVVANMTVAGMRGPVGLSQLLNHVTDVGMRISDLPRPLKARSHHRGEHQQPSQLRSRPLLLHIPLG